MRSKSTGIIIAAVLVIIAFLVSCTAPPPTPAPAPASKPAPAPTPAPSPTPAPTPAPAAPQPKLGGVINYPVTVFPAGYDPHRKPSFGPFVTIPVFNNLVRYDPTAKNNSPSTIVGDLAEKWTVSPDGLTWEFNLRQGVKWHDGKPFTADDVIFTFEKLKDPARSALSDYWKIVTSASKTNDYTVRLTLSTQSPSMLLQLTNCYAAVLPKHITADWRSPDFAVGTGPFKMKQAVAGTSIELQKNPDYYRKGFPYLDGIKIFAIPDIGAQMDAMSTKRIDMTNPMGFTIPSEEDMERFLKTSPGASWELRTQTYGNIIWINTRVPELKDVRVRKALALLEDRPALIEAAYGNKRWGGTSNAFFTPFWGLPPAEIAKVVGWDKPADQRLAEAKKLMADAGYADGFKTKIAMPTVNMPSYQRVSVLMDDIYRKNLKVELDIVPYPSADAIKKRNDGAYGLFNYSPLALLGDPDEFMPLFRTSGRENYSGYSNPDIDKLWDQQAKEMDVAKRKQLLQQIERILLTDLPAMPLQWNNYVTAWWPYVKGYVVADTTYTSNLAFETVWLDK